MKLNVILLVAGSLLTASVGRAADKPGEACVEHDAPRPFVFGLNPGTSDRDLTLAKAAGCTNIRIGAGWDLVEPEPGVYKWEATDRAVSQCLKYGLEPFFLIVATPRWALSPEKRDKPWAWPAEPEFYPQARTFYRMLAERYKGKVTYYEFWNEQNGFGWNKLNAPEEYAPILKIGYAALKEGNPDCVVAVGGLDGAGWKGYTTYLERLYELGCGDAFDAVAVHPYRVDGPIDGYSLKRIHEILVRHGDGDRKLWLTEYGWSNERGHDNKARWLSKSLNMLTSPEYYFVFQASVHTLRDFDRHEYGLCDRRGNPRAAYQVFKDYPKDWAEIRRWKLARHVEPALVIQEGFETSQRAWRPFGGGFETVSANDIGVVPEQGERVLVSVSSGDATGGGAYLRVPVPEGIPVRLSARVKTVHRGDSSGKCRVGIDPTGKTDPDGDSVVWSRGIETFDAWDSVGVGQGEPLLPQSDHVTLFLEYAWSGRGRGARVFDEVRFISRRDTFRLPEVEPPAVRPRPAEAE